jgi:hypothetical protein
MKESETALVARSLSFVFLSRVTLALLDLLLHCLLASCVRRGRIPVGTNQSAHGAVKSMPVVPAELRVGTLEGGVTVSLGLLDTIFATR